MRVVERFRANRVASFWSGRGGEEWLATYRDSWNRPYRHLLVDRVAELQPNSILELGCNVGPNLRLLAERLPSARISGVDINWESVVEAKRYLADYPNVDVKRRDLRSGLPAGEFDCVVSCYTLCCVSPPDIAPLLASAWRSTKKALVAMEPHKSTDSGWCHDYARIMHELGAKTITEEIDENEWGLDALTIAYVPAVDAS